MSDIINMDALGEHIDETVTGYLDENLDDIIKDSGEIEDGVEKYMERNGETLVDEHMDKLDIELMVREYLDGKPELIEAGIRDNISNILAAELERVKDVNDKAASNLDRFKENILKELLSYNKRIAELEVNKPNPYFPFLCFVSVILSFASLAVSLCIWS